MKKYLLLLALIYGSLAHAQTPNLKSIFNGRDLQGWTTFAEKKGTDTSTQNLFRIADGEIHVSGQKFAYIATKKTYSNFHFSVEFKWGDNRYPPRERNKRDAGICFHVQAEDKIWPKSIECQIQEGDVGDLWLIGYTTAVVAGKKATPKDYSRVIKKRDAEKPKGEWNTVEVISKNGTFKYIVNGVTVNEGEQLSLTSGRILLQSEGAELYYRNIKLAEL